MPAVLELRVVLDEAAALVPRVDGVDLTDAVRVFETSRGYDPAGGYGGLVPASFAFGDLGAYYLGRGARQRPAPGRLWLLGCSCGDLGCWPLEAEVVVTGGLVVWQDFGQPHRPARSYDGFGPFVFEREPYEAAVADAVRVLPPAARG